MQIARTLVALLLFGCLAATAYQPAGAEEGAEAKPNPELLEKVDAILQDLPVVQADPVWFVGERLQQLGDEATEPLRAKLTDGDAATVLACSYALLRLGAQRDATIALEALIADPKVNLKRRIDAAALLGNHGGGLAIARLQGMAQNEAMDEHLRVEVAKSLWRLTHGVEAQSTLIQMKNKAKSVAARNEAILALGRFGQHEAVKADLEALSEMPGDLGDEARGILIRVARLDKAVKRDQFSKELIGEVVQKVKDLYAPDTTDADEQKQLQPRSMASDAARALVRSIDDFNDYLDEEDYRELLEGVHSNYSGIGAWVGMRNELFTILTPMYGQPAFKAGLKSMDVVTKIDGVEIKDMKLNDIIKRLKGPAKTQVTVTIIRRGWDKPRDITITRDRIEIPMVLSKLLPGKIGYIRLNGFQEDANLNKSTSRELQRAIVDFKAKGVRGLLVDLRNNPGGLLSEAVEVCQKFLPRGELIVYSKGKVFPRRNYYSRVIGRPLWDGPMVVMINEGSASASEIVAGALRDHKRAKLVGQKSFGKGSVQQLIPVATTNDLTRLKLTIAKYYLPSDECIHRHGIKPDVEVEEPDIGPTEVEARWKLNENRDLEQWVEANFKKHPETFMRLLDFDGYSTEEYPGFEDLYASLTEKYPKLILDKDVVRKELRESLRAYARDKLGHEDYPVDVQESLVLQRALVELGEMMEEGLPEDVPLYKAFREKFAEADKVAEKSTGEGSEPQP